MGLLSEIIWVQRLPSSSTCSESGFRALRVCLFHFVIDKLKIMTSSVSIAPVIASISAESVRDARSALHFTCALVEPTMRGNYASRRHFSLFSTDILTQMPHNRKCCGNAATLAIWHVLRNMSLLTMQILWNRLRLVCDECHYTSIVVIYCLLLIIVCNFYLFFFALQQCISHRWFVFILYVFFFCQSPVHSPSSHICLCFVLANSSQTTTLRWSCKCSTWNKSLLKFFSHYLQYFIQNHTIKNEENEQRSCSCLNIIKQQQYMEWAALGVRGILFSASLSSHCALLNARSSMFCLCETARKQFELQ